jgi:hypothetical protein
VVLPDNWDLIGDNSLVLWKRDVLESDSICLRPSLALCDCREIRTVIRIPVDLILYEEVERKGKSEVLDKWLNVETTVG